MKLGTQREALKEAARRFPSRSRTPLPAPLWVQVEVPVPWPGSLLFPASQGCLGHLLILWIFPPARAIQLVPGETQAFVAWLSAAQCFCGSYVHPAGKSHPRSGCHTFLAKPQPVISKDLTLPTPHKSPLPIHLCL